MYFTVGLFFGILVGLVFLTARFITKYRRRIYGWGIKIDKRLYRVRESQSGYYDSDLDETF